VVAGKLVAQGSPSQIKGNQPGQLFEVVTDKNQAASDLLKHKTERWRVSIFADRLHIVLDHPDAEMPPLLAALADNGIRVIKSRPIPFSLEDAFIGIVQRAAGSSKDEGAAS
jgi:ABC-2 type transport system ATP-binding protein